MAWERVRAWWRRLRAGGRAGAARGGGTVSSCELRQRPDSSPGRAEGPAPPVGGWDVVMYTRQGCHLCERAWEMLEEERRRHGFALRAEDVDADPALAERYGSCVPVVVVNGRVRFRGVVNRVLLRRLFAGATGSS